MDQEERRQEATLEIDRLLDRIFVRASKGEFSQAGWGQAPVIILLGLYL